MKNCVSGIICGIIETGISLTRGTAIREDPNWRKKIIRCLYRPFDVQWCYFDEAAMDYPRRELKQHVEGRGNICMLLPRQIGFPPWRHASASTIVAESCVISTKTKEQNYIFPLYLYANGKLPEADLFAHDNGRRPNLSAGFIKGFCERLNCEFIPDGFGRPAKREVGPECIFNYAYAIFHSPTYRERYADFLRADFPRLPLTSNWDLFRELAGLGTWLVDLTCTRSRQEHSGRLSRERKGRGS